MNKLFNELFTVSARALACGAGDALHLISARSNPPTKLQWIAASRSASAIRNDRGFSLAEVLITLLIVCVISATSAPMVTKMMQNKANTDSNAIQCITANDSTGWYDSGTGDTTYSQLSGVCLQAVKDTQYDRGNAVTTAIWYADNGPTADRQTMGKKILRAACDQRGEKACEYFINSCVNTLADCDSSDFLDLTYYLHHIRTTSNEGAMYIYNQLKDVYLPKISTNLLSKVPYACTNNQNPDANENLNVNIACDLSDSTQSDLGNWAYIKSCNLGDTAACITAYNNDYNKSCTQVLTAWPDAPSGTYNLAYNGSGDTESVYCNMTSMATAAVTGCNASSENLRLSIPDDDCTFGETNNYNQTCDEIFASWPTAPFGTFNITETSVNPPDSTQCPEVQYADSGGSGDSGDTCTGYELEGETCIIDGVEVSRAMVLDGLGYGGGYVALIDNASAEYGTYNIETEAWDAYDGWSNTNKLTPAYDSTYDGYRTGTAAMDCRALGDEWYLPAIWELDYLNLDGYIGSGNYWSSTESQSSPLNASRLMSGLMQSWVKSENMAIRCLRKRIMIPLTGFVPTDVGCGSIDFLAADTGLDHDFKVTSCDQAIDPIPADGTDHGCDGVTCCWYGNGDTDFCDGTGCGTEISPGNYDKYICTHAAAVKACHALNGSDPSIYGFGCDTGECTVNSTGWRLPNHGETHSFKYLTALTDQLDPCFQNGDPGVYPECEAYSGCFGADSNECNPKNWTTSIWDIPNNRYTAIGFYWTPNPDTTAGDDYGGQTVRCVRTLDSSEVTP